MALTAQKNGANLNNFTTVGQYYFKTTVGTVEYLNLPKTNLNGTLIVTDGASDYGIRQIFIPKDNIIIYQRRRTSSGGWTEWHVFASDTEMFSMLYPVGTVMLAFRDDADKVCAAANSYNKKYGSGGDNTFVVLDGPSIKPTNATQPLYIIERVK